MPSTWVAPRVWVAGERVGASKMNEISTALGILFPYTAAGDIAYRDPAGAYLTRLAKPTVDSFLKNTSAGVLSWSAGANGINAKAITSYAVEQEITATSYTDVTSATVNITTTQICTLLMFAEGTMGNDYPSHAAYARCSIGGNVPASDSGSAKLDNGYGTGVYPYSTMFYKTGVAAGTTTCKVQAKLGTTGGILYHKQGTIIVLAIVD